MTPSTTSPRPESCAPFAGDGGPATAASLCTPTDVLALPDGSVVISDSGNARLRRVAPDGTISTLAGTGWAAGTPPWEAGQPATEAALVLLGGLARSPEREVLFAEHHRVSVIGAGGRLRTVVELAPSVAAVEPEEPPRDFTGRQPTNGAATGIATTREGGLLVAAGNAYYLAPERSRRTLVAIRGARVAEESLTVAVDATRAARATVTVWRDGEPVARRTRRIGAGRARIRVPGRFRAEPHDVRVTMRSAEDGVPLLLATSLPSAYARRLAEWYADDEEPVARCRRMSARRIDCAYGGAGLGCARVESFTLRRTGVLWWHGYGCDDLADPFRPRPDWRWEALPIGAPDP